MRSMTPYSACAQHHFATESRCPHCGAAARPGLAARVVRQAKMSGVMLFTALTTTACYGVPAAMDVPLPGQPGYEQPLPRVPAETNTAYVFATPAGSAKAEQTARGVWARVDGDRLTVSSVRGDGFGFEFSLQAPSAEAFAALQGVRQPLDVAEMKALTAVVNYNDPPLPSSTPPSPKRLTLELAGAKAAQGSLQLSRVDESAMGGVLRVEIDGTLLEIYFLAGRS